VHQLEALAHELGCRFALFRRLFSQVFSWGIISLHFPHPTKFANKLKATRNMFFARRQVQQMLVQSRKAIHFCIEDLSFPKQYLIHFSVYRPLGRLPLYNASASDNKSTFGTSHFVWAIQLVGGHYKDSHKISLAWLLYSPGSLDKLCMKINTQRKHTARNSKQSGSRALYTTKHRERFRSSKSRIANHQFTYFASKIGQS
jgi:hypothetical protein